MSKLECLICGKKYRHLGSHIWHKHKILAREYKEKFGLPYDEALISEDIKIKKQIAFEKDREKYLKNLEGSEKYQFKKGRSGHRRVSEKERQVIIERIKIVNKNKKPEKCPICNLIYENLDSHLFMKHGFLKIKKLNNL
jgi:hypothetical protein